MRRGRSRRCPKASSTWRPRARRARHSSHGRLLHGGRSPARAAGERPPKGHRRGSSRRGWRSRSWGSRLTVGFSRWPGSGHVHTPPQGAADARKAHQPPAQLSPSTRQPHRPYPTHPTTRAEASSEIKSPEGPAAELARRGSDRAQADRRSDRLRPPTTPRGSATARSPDTAQAPPGSKTATNLRQSASPPATTDDRQAHRARALHSPAGERVLYGQRIDGVVRFQPGERDVLVLSSRAGEDGTCCPA